MTAIEKICCFCDTNIIGQKSYKNATGNYCCDPCYQEQVAKPAAGQNTQVDEPIYNSDAPPPIHWSHTLSGGAIISVGILILSMFTFALLPTLFPASFRSPVNLGIVVIGCTILLIIKAGFLLASMLIASRLLSDINFGQLGGAIWKALLVVLLYTLCRCIIYSIDDILAFSTEFLLLFICFMTVFRINPPGALGLALINKFLFFLLGLLHLGMMIS